MNEIELSNDLEGKTKEEARTHLKGFYELAYNTNVYRPINSYITWVRLMKYFKEEKKEGRPFKRAIEIGCGIGIGVSFAREMGYDVWGIDIARPYKYWNMYDIGGYCLNASALNIPFKNNSFDFVLIPDVMEHIPEEDILDTLREIRRIGSEEFLYYIHTSKEDQPIRVVNEKGEFKIHTHICRQGPEWWRIKLTEAGYCISNYKIKEPHIMAHCLKEKKDGKEFKN